MTGANDSAYASKGDAYFGNARHDFVAALPNDSNARILELGCGNGATGALALAQGKAGFYVGIELVASMGLAAEAVLSAVRIGDIESMVLPYAEDSFDALICSEVLEHLREPEVTLERLAKFLRIGGKVYASVPNVANWRILWRLIRGDFEYTDSGLMDRTHLRWFTPRSFKAMFEGCGFSIEKLAPTGSNTLLRSIASATPLGHLAWSQIDIVGRRIR